MDGGSDSDSPPEEFTMAENIRQEEEIRKAEKESSMRVTREKKERRKKWAQKKPQSKLKKNKDLKVDESPEEQEEIPSIPGMLPSNIIDLLAAREKQTFASDSEDEVIDQKPSKRKKRQKNSGPETILLKAIPPPQCLQNSLEFLKRRKAQVARSDAVLKNSIQALRLLSSKGGLLSSS